MNTRCNSKPHKQVIAKVNAYVDEGIKELVEILNTLDGVCTFESCQKDKDNFAYIDFVYGLNSYNRRQCNKKDLMEIVEFVDRLAKSYSKIATKKNNALATENYQTGFSIEIFIDWIGKMDTPLIKLRIPYRLLKQVTDIFLHLKKGLGHDIVCKQLPNHEKQIMSHP
jgi:hypothetical protein